MFELNLLEYNKIKNIIKKYALLSSTNLLLEQLSPSFDKEEIKLSLTETSELVNAIYRIGKIEFESLTISNTLSRLKVMASLNVQEFLEINKLINNSSRVTAYFKKLSLIDLVIDKIIIYAKNIKDLSDVKKEIDLIIDFDGVIKDNASPKLYAIRRELRISEARINDKLNQIIKTEGSKLSESIVTIRGSHKVLPVKAEYKNQIKGLVLSESSSGSTVFILPYACLELENLIQEKREEENKEIERILYELSMKVFERYDDILNNSSIISELDLIQAKALYAKETDSIMPIISEEIDLINARHPLIDPKVIVPNTITFKNKKTMIITGPNTGGKTVVLKTLGLLSLMAQSGMLIPVSEGSKIRVFEGIYADIGDEQSIEQSLSTFSSHMKRIVNILKDATMNSLVLLDELGSGTDPKEGASLAIAIINKLRTISSYTIATTHYSELKAYAYNHEDILNASVEFDVDTLKPTFRLIIGVPGRSNALLISRRLGLDEDVIKDAESVNLEFSDEISNLMKKLEEEAFSLNKNKEEYYSLIKVAKETKEKNDQQNEELSAKLHKEIDNINSKKNSILIKTQNEASHLLDEIKELKKELENKVNVKDHQITDLKSKVNSLYQDKLIKEKINEHEIKLGDNVRVLAFDKIGTVTAIKKDRYEVTMGILSSLYKKDEIEYEQLNDELKKVFVKTEIPKIEVENSLDLRGVRYEEAFDMLDKYVDSCLLNNVDFAYIVHGMGTLALRNMTTDYAKTHSAIKKYRFGNGNEGGNGVTIYYFK